MELIFKKIKKILDTEEKQLSRKEAKKIVSSRFRLSSNEANEFLSFFGNLKKQKDKK